ncbi:EndoU domain-containing protein, partial [Enterococcus sp. LJL51]|uniref:EndoU domain-containing protein n=1 Tax=Enterococcus sp. LJL51 TaxID=3416656 RepID=UPI003CEDD0FD
AVNGALIFFQSKLPLAIANTLDMIGTVTNATEAWTGKELITGRKLSTGERILKVSFAVLEGFMLGYNGAKTVKGKVTKVPEIDGDAGSTYHGQTVRGKNYHVRIGSNAENHLKNAEKITGKTVSGGHNLKKFETALLSLDSTIGLDDCILRKTPHPTISGVYEIEYQLPMQVSGGALAQPIKYKKVQYPKTVYDPNMINDAQMIAWGKEAMQNGIFNQNTGEIIGHASNGLKFKGYIKEGAVTNFYPILK